MNVFRTNRLAYDIINWELNATTLDKAAQLANRAPKSNLLLFLLPIMPEFHVPNEVIRHYHLVRQLSSPLPMPPSTCLCGASLHPDCSHLLFCPKFSRTAFTLRHNIILQAFLFVAALLGIPYEKEPRRQRNQSSTIVVDDTQTSNSPENLVPDGIIYFITGKPLAFDVTVSCALAPSHLRDSSRSSGATARKQAIAKINKYKEYAVLYNCDFLPAAFESHGAFDRDISNIIYPFAEEAARQGRSTVNDFKTYMKNLLAVALAKGNYAALLHATYLIKR